MSNSESTILNTVVMSTIFTSTHKSYKRLKYYFNRQTTSFSYQSYFSHWPTQIFTTKKPPGVFYGVEMMLLGRLRCRRRWKQRKRQKRNGLRLAKQQLCQVQHNVLVHFFVGTAPPRREIAKFHPHIDKVKNRRQLSLLFSLSNLNIFITNSTPGGLVLIWLRPRPHLFFFSVFDKKYAYSRSVFEPFSPIHTFSKPAPFPVSAG